MHAPHSKMTRKVPSVTYNIVRALVGEFMVNTLFKLR